MDCSQSAPRISFGDPPSRAILILIAVNVIVYVLQLIPALGTFAGAYLALDTGAVFAKLRLWQFVTSMFLHGHPMHLLGNMIMLYFFGNSLAQAWRGRQFLWYYFLCGIAAGLCFFGFALVQGQPLVAVGASGAVFGVMIAFGMIFGERMILFFFIPMKAKVAVAICFALSILMLLAGIRDGVAHIAHVGGAVFGAIYLKGVWWGQERKGHPGATGRKAKTGGRIAGLEVYEE